MTFGDHPREDLAPYALGMLDAVRSGEVDAHVASCASCATELGSYESTVAAMVEAEFPAPGLADDVQRRLRDRIGSSPTPLRMRSRVPSVAALAVAAVLALAVGVLGTVDMFQRDALRSDGAFFTAMIASHFAHSQFQTVAGSPIDAKIDAKVVYDRRGHWYEVIARGIDASYRVAVVAGTGEPPHERAERFVARGETFALRIESTTMITALELRSRDGRVVARAQTPSGDGR